MSRYEVPTEPTALEFRDVVKHYKSGDEVVRAADGVSLTVQPGEVVALFGPSGSGKTTLLEIAAVIETPDSGSVHVGGREVSALTEPAVSNYRMYELGFVHQSAKLLPGANVLRNATTRLLGTRISVREARRRVIPLLEQLGLDERLKHLPDQLSTGERQRVMIARALSTNPRVLLADEPTGSLDVKRTHEVLAMLRSITLERQMATLLVTHDAHAIEYADRVFDLEDGSLHERVHARSAGR